MDYVFTKLTEQDRQAIIDERVTQFERELFNHQLVIEGLNSLDSDSIDIESKARQIEESEKAISVLVSSVSSLTEQSSVLSSKIVEQLGALDSPLD